MIRDKLYEQNDTYSIPGSKLYVTSQIINIPVTDENAVSAFQGYWVGWMNNDNLPDIFKPSIINAEQVDGVWTYSIEDANNPDEYSDIGLTAYNYAPDMPIFSPFRYRPTYNPPRWAATKCRMPDNSVIENGYGDNVCLVNDVKYQNFSIYQLQLNWIWIQNPYNSPRHYITNYWRPQNYIKFINGEYTYTFSSTTIFGREVDVTINDFDENGFIDVAKLTNNALSGILFLVSYRFNPLPSTSTDILYPHNNGTLQTMVSRSFVDKDGAIGRNIISSRGVFTDSNGLMRINGVNVNPIIPTFNYSLTAAEGTNYESSDVLNMPRYLNHAYTEEPFTMAQVWNQVGNNRQTYTNGNITWVFSAGEYHLYVALNPHSIYRHMGLYRWFFRNEGLTNEVGYAEGQDRGIYYPKVNLETNEFLGELITGATAEEVEPRIPEWMYGDDLSQSIYDPETDKPTPGEPGEKGDDDEGDIPLNVPGALGATNAFVTRYVLNTKQIRTIGQELWSTLGNGNELTWKNFFLTVTGSEQIDYSLTLAEIISYFVNLKYFPFNLNSVSSATGENGIRIGTGVTLIGAGSGTKSLNDCIITLDGGTCTIPNKWSNYLDYEPYTTATIYVPYCGTTELPMSVISGQTLGITYLVDLTTGAMTAAIVKYTNLGVSFPIAVMNGSCGFDILMTGTNGNSQMTNAITGLATKANQWVGQTLQTGLTGLMGGISGKDASGFGGLAGMANNLLGIGQDMVQQNIQMPKTYATQPMLAGTSSSLSSLILPQTAYIQIRRHNPYRPSGVDYAGELALTGFRSAYMGLISSANGMGFVKCQNPNLALAALAGATETEINMIKSLLSDGIFT